MSQVTFSTTVGLHDISLSVDDDWSGLARVSVRRCDSSDMQVGYAQATCDVRLLLVGVLDLVRHEVGEIRAHEWPLFVALVAREHARARAVACLAQVKL
jgi:hypothetical protein